MPQRDLSPEELIKLAERQLLWDAYYDVFRIARDDSHAASQKRVIDDMQKRAFYTMSTFFDNPDEAKRCYREGQRSFMLETMAFIEKGKKAPKMPATQAHSNTAR